MTMKSVELAIPEAQIHFDQLVARFTPDGGVSKKPSTTCKALQAEFSCFDVAYFKQVAWRSIGYQGVGHA